MLFKRARSFAALLALLCFSAVQLHGVLHGHQKAVHQDSASCQLCVSALTPTLPGSDLPAELAGPDGRQFLAPGQPTAFIPCFAGSSHLLRGPPQAC